MHLEKDREKEKEESAGIAEERDMCQRNVQRPKEKERDKEE